MNRVKHYIYNFVDKELILYKVDLKLDFACLYNWMHQPHVQENWQLDKPADELLQHFEFELAKPHQELFMLEVDGLIIGYAEIYQACKDRLANFYTAGEQDYGIHLLIGETSNLGKGYSSVILCGLSDYLFRIKQAKRVMVEPNVKVQSLTILERKLGFSNLGLLQLSEKDATLYAIEPKEFYQTNPSLISCNSDDWPLVYLHFPSYPTDIIVANWLNSLDNIIKRKSPYLVISSFDENYQFSQQARKLEIFWFKRNKPLLQKYCLAMLRVTTDPLMIAKLANPAMEKGMPFKCIACPDLIPAKHMAQTILANYQKPAVQ